MSVVRSTPECLPDEEQVSSARARSLVDELINSPADTPFSARSALQQYPFLRNHHSCVLDLAYEEYCRRRETGDDESVTAFVNRYQSVQQSLIRVIELDRYLHDHPSVVDAVPDSAWPRPGEVYRNRFQLLEQIGRGAWSRVFLARQTEMGSRLVVIKVCFRGEREADLLGQLQHPGIGPVHSIDTDPDSGLSAICMPYLTRTTLHYLSELMLAEPANSDIRCGRLRQLVSEFNQSQQPTDVPARSTTPDSRPGLSDDEPLAMAVLQWGADLADALSFAHQKNVLHCDVKPGNILVLPDLSVSLLDFNLASQHSDQGSSPIGGTLPYMASEQLRRLIPADSPPPACTPATDTYGLCASLWFMATGSPPFGVAVEAGSQTAAAAELLQRQQQGISDEQLQLARRHLPEAVVRLLLAGLDVDPDRRPQLQSGLSSVFRRLLARRRGRRVRLRRAVAATVLTAAVLTFAATRNAPATLHNNAAQLMQSGQYAEAEPILQQLVEDRPDNAEYVADLASCQIHQQSWSEALQTLRPFVAQHSDPHCNFLLSVAEVSQLPEYIGELRQGVRTVLNDQQPQLQRDFEGARKQWQLLLKTWGEPDPNSRFRDFSLLNLAWIQFHMSLVNDSLQTFRQVPLRPSHDSHFAESHTRLDENLQIQQELGKGQEPTSAQLTGLRDRVAQDGLRGEVLLLLQLLLGQADDPGNQLTQGQRQELLTECLDILQSHGGVSIHQVEGQVLTESRLIASSDRKRDLWQTLQRPTGPETTRLPLTFVIP